MKKILYTLFVLIVLSTVSGELWRVSVAGISLLPTDVLIPPLLALWGLDKWKNDWNLRLGKVGKTTVLFFFILLATYFLNYFRFDTGQMVSGIAYLGRLGMYGVTSLVAFDLLDRDKSGFFKKLLLGSMIAAMVLICILGFLQLKYYPNFHEMAMYLQGWDPHIGRLLSTWFDPNFVGGFLGFMLPITLGIALYFYRKREFKLSFLLGVAAFIGLIALYFTYSRSAYLTLIAGMGFFTLFKSRRLLVAFVILLILGFSLSPRVQQRTIDAYESGKTLIGLETQKPMDPTSRFRVDSWIIASELIRDYPVLGVGYGRYAFEVNERGRGELGIHSSGGSDSSLLNIWAQGGVFSLIAYLAIFFVAAVQAIKRIWGRDDFDSYLQLGFLSGFVGIFVHSFFVNSLLFALIMVYLWLSLAMMDSK